MKGLKLRLIFIFTSCGYEIKSYKQKYTERIKKAADRKKKEKERILNETLAPMRKQCEEIGFKRGTKNFKDCVVELM